MLLTTIRPPSLRRQDVALLGDQKTVMKALQGIFAASCLVVVLTYVWLTELNSSVKIVVHSVNFLGIGTDRNNKTHFIIERTKISHPKDTAVNTTRAINSAQKKPKVVLYWTSFFGDPKFTFGFGQEPFKRQKCAVDNCIATNDRKRLNEANALLFHMRDVRGLGGFPKKRFPWQYYVFFCLENPVHQFNNLHSFKGVFNWTMSYRLNSDILWPYGRLEPRSTPLPAPLDDRIIATKTKPIAWFVSHCQTHSRRETYVRLLQKEIAVDIYGTCGPHRCSRGQGDKCYDMLQKQYFFYLSFENNICTDYITEKMFKPLEFNVVPIVMGGGNYSVVAPPHSVINIEDFKSPKELAIYLKKLMANKEEYLSYFKWKEKLQVRWDSQHFCTLCEKLNQEPPEQKIHKDLFNWWQPPGTCNPGRLKKNGLI